MSSNITLSAAVRSNLLSLQNTASLLDTTQTRLATGNKVNSALDNPTNYFTASSLNSRASDLGNLLDGVSNAIQTIQAASDGITAIQKLVDSAKATANQAQQLSETVGGGAGTAATGAKVTAGAFSPINVSATSSSPTAATMTAGAFTGPLDLSGSAALSFTLKVDGTDKAVTIDAAAIATYNTANPGNTVAAAALTGDDVAALINAQLTGATASFDGTSLSFTSGSTGTGSTLEITGTSDDTTKSGIVDTATPVTGSAAGAAASMTFSVTVDGTNKSITLSDATVSAYNTAKGTSFSSAALTAANVAAMINYQFDNTGATTVASGASGNLVFSSSTTGTGSTVSTTAVTTAGTLSGSLGVTVASNTGLASTPAGGSTPNPARGALISQYNDLLDQINQLAGDANYNGNNLLVAGSSLKVLFNEAGTSNLTIQGKASDATGLGLATLTSTDFDSNTSITATLDKLKGATDTLRANASSFGSNLSIVQMRQDFTKSIINTLQTGASNLTLADSNEEAANLLALQTRQSLSTKALSMASQSDQNVLRLLQ